MSLLAQEYLQTHSLKHLEKEYRIYARFANEGNKISLNYNQIFSKNDCPLTKDCRGLILRAQHHDPTIICGETEIVAYPFRRFFNFGQIEADEIDWDKSYKIEEKKDGSLAILYWDDFENHFCVGTRSVPNADLPMNDGGLTFSQLFKQIIEQEYENWDGFCSYLDKKKTYCFEICSPYNQIVVKHNECNVFLLGVRDLKTLQELEPKQDPLLKVFPNMENKQYDKMSTEQIIEFVNSRPGFENEGVVIVQEQQGSFKRLKIKNKDYNTLNRQIDLFGSRRNQVQFCLSEAYDDLIVFVSSRFKEEIEMLREQVIAFCKKNDERFEEIKNIKEQRDFAQAMREGDFSSCLYELRKLNRKDVHMNTFNWILSRKKNEEVPTQIIDQILKRLSDLKRN